MATGGINIITIPTSQLNVDLTLDNYVEYLSKAKNKNDLKNILYQIWDQATRHGALTERVDKLQSDADALHVDLLCAEYDIEIEYLEDDSD